MTDNVNQVCKGQVRVCTRKSYGLIKDQNGKYDFYDVEKGTQFIVLQVHVLGDPELRINDAFSHISFVRIAILEIKQEFLLMPAFIIEEGTEIVA